MPTKLTPQEFVAKWKASTLKEKSAAQEHFINLCQLVGHATPAEADPTGEKFTFKGACKDARSCSTGRCAHYPHPVCA
ncbi:MAG: hypothetical protein L6R45_02510 [Anaerolineae bacterium]|nr:hypothetical protein [Anaerolineae bacterium]